jgi:hypothetical protein
MGGNPNDVKFIYDAPDPNGRLPQTISGAHYVFTDQFIDAVKKKGINAFKDGGLVSIDKMIASL